MESVVVECTDFGDMSADNRSVQRGAPGRNLGEFERDL